MPRTAHIVSSTIPIDFRNGQLTQADIAFALDNWIQCHRIGMRVTVVVPLGFGDPLTRQGLGAKYLALSDRVDGDKFG